jgi:anti-sigma B factor antagonist
MEYLSMVIDVNESDDVVNVIVKGSIELYTCENFKNVLFEITKTTDKNIDVDLLGVEYMDSSGIGVLISIYKIQNKKGKKLVVSKVPVDIYNLLKLSTLADVFEA